MRQIDGKQFWWQRLEVLWIFAAAFAFCGWTLHHSNFFFTDDYAWLWFVQRTPLSDFAYILPNSPYNDRPVGIVILKFLFGAFEMNPVLHHFFLLLVHIGSAVLLYLLLRLFIKRYDLDDDSGWGENVPWVSAMLFAGWFASNDRPVSWDAAIFDLIACPLILLSSLCFFMAQGERFRIVYGLGCLFFYALALRTKEMAVVLPCMLFCVVVWGWFSQKYRSLKPVRSNGLLLLLLFALMAGYLARILWVKSAYPGITDPAHPYYLSSSPVLYIRNLSRYLRLYFNPWQHEHTFGFETSMYWPLWMALCLIAFIVLGAAAKHRSPIILAPLLFVIQLAPVLPMQNMQSRLYLYVPSLFLSILSASVLCWLTNLWQFSHWTSRWPWFFRQGITGLLATGLLVFVNYSGRAPSVRAFYLEVGRVNENLYKALTQMPRPVSGTTVYITNVPKQFEPLTLFSKGAGSGDVLRAYFKDPRLEAVVVSDPEYSKALMLDQANCVWEYNDGYLKAH